MNAATHRIEAAITSTHDFQDGPDLLNQVSVPIIAVYADGAYAHQRCYEAITARHATPYIPGRRRAKIKQHDHSKALAHPRDEHWRFIRALGRKQWERHPGYYKRSLTETGIYRFKQLLGDKRSNRVFAHQATEAFIQCDALNRMTSLGMPESYAA